MSNFQIYKNTLTAHPVNPSPNSQLPGEELSKGFSNLSSISFKTAQQIANINARQSGIEDAANLGVNENPFVGTEAGRAYATAYDQARQGYAQMHAKEAIDNTLQEILSKPQDLNAQSLVTYNQKANSIISGINTAVPNYMKSSISQYGALYKNEGMATLGAAVKKKSLAQFQFGIYQFLPQVKDDIANEARLNLGTDPDLAKQNIAEMEKGGIAKIRAGINIGAITAIQGDSLAKNLTTSTQDTLYLQGYQNAQKSGNTEQYAEGIINSDLPIDQKQNIMRKIIAYNNSLKSLGNASSADLKNTQNNLISMIRNGATPNSQQPVIDKLKNFGAYTPELQDKMNVAQWEAHVSSIALTASPNQINQIFQETKPIPDDPDYAIKMKFYNNLISTFNVQRQKLWDNSPLFLQSHPIVQQSLENSKTAIEVGGISINPNQKGFSKSIEGLIYAQKQLGKPDSQLQILAKSAAGNLAAKIRSANPVDAFKILQNIQDQYGSFTPIVFRQLRKNGVDAASFLVFRASNNPDTISATPDLINALDTSQKQISDGIRTYNSSTSQPISSAAIRSTVVSDLSDYLGTVNDYNSISLRDKSAIVDPVAKYATYLILEKGKDMNDAAQEAADTMINNQYKYFNIDSDQQRIPISELNKYGLTTFQINNIASTIKDNIVSSDNFTVPNQYNILYAKIPENERITQYKDDMLEDAHFITAPDESGLILVDAKNNPVLNAKGQRYTLSWQKISQDSQPKAPSNEYQDNLNMELFKISQRPIYE